MRKAVLIGLVAVGVGLAAGGRAPACTLVLPLHPPDPRAVLAEADAAFIGTLVDVRPKDPPPPGPGPITVAGPYVFTYAVAERIKGDLPDRVEVVAWSSATCGLDGPVGRRIGLLLRGKPGEWTAGLSDQVDPDWLRRGALPLPEPNGVGAPAFLVGGRFGVVRTALLDAAGRTLRYGAGRGGVTALSVCPGRRAVVELVARDGAVFLATRTLPSLTLISERRLLPSGYGDSVFCRDRSGSTSLATVLVFDRKEPETRLVRVTPVGSRTLESGKELAVAVRGEEAFVSGADGRLGVRNLRTGQWRFVVSTVLMLRRLAVSPDGRRLAGFTAADGLTVVDVQRRTVTTYNVAWSPLNTVSWLGRDRLAASSGGELRLFDSTLQPVGGPQLWRVHTTAISAAGAFGIDHSGGLLTIRGGWIERLGTLFSPSISVLVRL